MLEALHILTRDANQGCIRIVKMVANERTCNALGRIYGKCWTDVTESPNMEKNWFGQSRNVSVEDESIKSYTEEFGMVRDWNNGSSYINSWYIWERASMLGGTKDDCIWFVRIESKAIVK